MIEATISEGAPQRMRRRNSRPYHMRGRPEVTEERKTSVDPPDRRMKSVLVTPLPPKSVAKAVEKLRGDPRLRTTDWCFQRWAATPGAGVNVPTLAQAHYEFVSHDSRAPALSDRDSTLIDMAVRTAPNWARTFVLLWYRSERTVSEIAAILRIKRREEVYDERKIVLAYFLGRLAQMGFELATCDPLSGPQS